MLKKILIRLLSTVFFAFIGAIVGFVFLAVIGLRGDSETILTPIIWSFWLGAAFGFFIPGLLSRGTKRPPSREARLAIDAGLRKSTGPD